jgi:hypothetical protein
MNSQRRRRIGGGGKRRPAAAVADDELVARLRALLPPAGQAVASSSSSSTALAVEEACAYIRRLHAEVDGLADQLARLLAPAGDNDEDDADHQLILRALSLLT